MGRVAQSGRTVVVPQVSQEPLFLDRSGVFRRSGRSEMSYVCVPIRAEHRTVGALGVALAFQKDRSYDHEAKFYGLVGSMIGQAVRVHHLVEAERKRLLDENTKLRRELTERYDIRNLVGTAGRCRPSTSRWRRSPPRTRPCCCAGSRAPARSWWRTRSTTPRRAPRSPSSR